MNCHGRAAPQCLSCESNSSGNWGLSEALEFCACSSRAEAAHSVLDYCHENAQSETKRSFKVGGCWSVLGLGLSPVLRKQKQQVVLFRAGMSLLGQVLSL